MAETIGKSEAGSALIKNIAEELWVEPPAHLHGAYSKMLVCPENADTRRLDHRISCYQPRACVEPHAHRVQEQIYHVLDGEGFSVDSELPAIGSLTAAPARLSDQPGHDTLSVTFDVSEAADVEVRAGGAEVSGCDESDNGDDTFTYACSFAVTAAAGGGSKNVTVSAADDAGNSASDTVSVVFDFDPPQLVSADPGQPAYRTGETLVYTVNADEPIAAPTLVVTHDSGGPVDDFFGDPVQATGTGFVYTRDVLPADAGSYTVRVDLEDEAGNTLADAAGTAFVIDVAAPDVTDLEAAPPRLSAGPSARPPRRPRPAAGRCRPASRPTRSRHWKRTA